MKKNLEGALLALMLASSQAWAQRLSFTDFSGPGGAPIRSQLVTQVCDTADCVAATKVTTAGKPDVKKAKKESLQYFITGAVVKKGKSLDLTVLAVGKTLAPKAHKSFPVEGGGLSARNLQAAIDLLKGAIGTGESTPEVRTAPVQPPPAAVRPEPEPVRQPEPVAQTPVAPPPAPPEPKAFKQYFLAIDVGADLGGRSLSYAQLTSANLRQYSLPFFPLPSLKLEFYPLALVLDGVLSGLGLEGGFAFAPFLKSRRESDTVTYPTSAMRIDAGLRWRIMPIRTYALAIIPYVGLRLQSFTVSAAASGDALDGLPNIAYTGLRAGLGLEVPIIGNLLMVFGRFGVLPTFSAGQIISKDYFTSGSTFGFEAAGGVDVGFTSFLHLRLSFEYSQYGLTFKTQPTDTYVAAGATDRFLGGNASVRLQF